MNDEPLKVLGFAGSLRQKSHNRNLLRAAETVLPQGMTLEIFDLIDIPLFNQDVEAEGIPAPVMAFREAMKKADSLLIATPEYNWSIPGVLKNALDWVSRKGPDLQAPLDGKTIAVMGAGGGYGTMRAQLHLREILAHNRLHVLPHPQLMVVKAWQHFDEDGTLTDEATRERLAEMLLELRDFTWKLNGKPELAHVY
ncbi:MAG: NAD(P)H-dependent oxidoreductase [Anaerolineae bacterium]|nr:NAD(P)H-dependent oxidoreductase [Anaerolineae bacterium]